jgi:glucose-6-phosphate 1-dehydrogenase
VPFYLRTGKRLAAKRSEIVIHFKSVPHNVFQASYRKLPANRLIIRLQPDEGVEIEMLNKVPGLDRGVRLQRSTLDLSFTEEFKNARIPDAYERLLLEAMQANQTLFLRRDEVEQAWTWIDSIQDAWREMHEPPKAYPAGSWGPASSMALLSRDGREWAE